MVGGIVFTIVLGSTALGGGAPKTQPSNADIRAVVAFVGDSNISFGGQSPVADLTYGTDLNVYPGSELNDNYVPVFVARGGAGIRAPDCLTTSCATDDFWKIKLAATFAKITPDAVVTDLGINDALIAGTATTQGYADYGDKIDWLMGLLPDKPVFWTNLPCAIEPPAYRPGCETVNNSLTVASQRWSNLVVLNWGDIADNHPGWMRYEGTVYGVHYTDAGYDAWTQLVLGALDIAFPK